MEEAPTDDPEREANEREEEVLSGILLLPDQRRRESAGAAENEEQAADFEKDASGTSQIAHSSSFLWVCGMYVSERSWVR